LALEIATQITYPSWGYFIEQGATTLWELWENTRYSAPGSLNHIMFGGQGSWYYKTLAGIENAGVAWNQIQFNPYIASNTSWPSISPLTEVSASIEVQAGRIASDWQFTDSLCQVVPENTNLVITCLSGTIQQVDFASFGLPTGSCVGNSLQVDSSCDASDSVSIVQQLCVGKSSCTVAATDGVFGDPCFGQVKRLAVRVSGCQSVVYQHNVEVPVGSSGDVHFPSSSGLSIMESNQAVWQDGAFVSGVDGVLSAYDNGAQVIVTIGSGSYQFQVSY